VELVGLTESFLAIDDMPPTAPDSRFPGRADIATRVRILRSRALRQAAIGRLIDDRVGQPDPEWSAAVYSASAGVEITSTGDNRIIDIACRSASPEAAAGMVNALAQQFVLNERESRLQQAAETHRWMEGQLEVLAVRTQRSEDLLQEYARDGGLYLDGSDSGAVSDGDLDALKRELIDARSERMRLQARAELLPGAGVAALPSEETPSLRDQQAALNSLLSRRAELAAINLPEHHKLQQLEAQIAEVREGLEQERVWILRRFETDFTAAARREKLLEQELELRQADAGLAQQKLLGYRRVEREAEANRELHAAFLKTVRQAGIAAGTPADAVRILATAEVPSEPLGPRPVLGAIAGMFTGLFASCLFVIARAKLDRTIKRPGDARRALGLRELGVMPDAAFEQERVRMTPAGFATQAPPLAEKACIDDRPSWLAECVRGIRTSLLHGPESPRVLTITSPMSGEGKTTVAANLAASLAESGRRTLIIDADLRRPRLHEVFGASNSQGLVDLLVGAYFDPLEFTVAVSKGLWFLPAGVAAFGGPGLLHEAGTRKLLERLRREFDTVVLDVPPVLAVSDARSLSRIVDGTILVVRAGVTDPEDAIEAKSLLESDGAHLLGIVLNSWNPRIYGPERYEKYGASYQSSAAA
jgi:capsular exopolysaccharide synthesis family protein